MALTYIDKGSSGTQIDVRTGTLSIGHIGKEMFSNLLGGGPRWRWYLKLDHNAVPPGCVRDAYAETFDEAKEAVERNWRIWLRAAGLTERLWVSGAQEAHRDHADRRVGPMTAVVSNSSATRIFMQCVFTSKILMPCSYWAFSDTLSHTNASLVHFPRPHRTATQGLSGATAAT